MRTLQHVLRALGYGSLGAILILVVGFVLYLDNRPDLDRWHEASLDAEFEADSEIRDFEAYLALEDRLFAQLEEQVYARTTPSEGKGINRYARGSHADPSRWSPDWNRSFELTPDAPTAGVVMLHGMSDSPYSMRSLAQMMHRERAHVVGLRIPGHGVAPAGLVHVRWEDMAAAVELAVAHVRQSVGSRPVYVFGYSNGGALAVFHALSALEDSSVTRVDRLVLMSPEIGVAKVAALAVWQGRLGRLLGLHKLAWNSILPEYDPYQYKSFAVNAGQQAYALTLEIQSRITQLAADGKLKEFPPTLAFQSTVDATVSAPDVVENLMRRLPNAGNELVLFDINRSAGIEGLLKNDPHGWLEQVFHGRENRFSVTLVTNGEGEPKSVIAQQLAPQDHEPTVTDLGLTWPDNVYSLAHIALPFPPNDPIYGGPDAAPSQGVHLGNLALRGERGTLRVSGNDLLRMHWNPFHSYLEQRILDFLR
jgi:alpha-beta hydrolase superfamily lysophospholipase